MEQLVGTLEFQANLVRHFEEELGILNENENLHRD